MDLMGVFFVTGPSKGSGKLLILPGQKIAFARLCSLLENEKYINLVQQTGQNAEKTFRNILKSEEAALGLGHAMIAGASASAVSASRWHSSCTKRTRCLDMLTQKMR